MVLLDYCLIETDELCGLLPDLPPFVLQRFGRPLWFVSLIIMHCHSFPKAHVPLTNPHNCILCDFQIRVTELLVIRRIESFASLHHVDRIKKSITINANK